MTFEKFEVNKKQNVSTIAFYSAVSNILNKNFKIIPERELGGKYKRVDFVTESKHCFEVKFTTLDFKSFKKNLECLYRDQIIASFENGSNGNITYITNILHNDSDETYVTIGGKKVEILTIENLLYLCGNNPVLRTILLGSLNISTESIVPQPISEELEKELEKDRKLTSLFYFKNFLSERISQSTSLDAKQLQNPSKDVESFDIDIQDSLDSPEQNSSGQESSETGESFCLKLQNELKAINKGKQHFSKYENYCKKVVDIIFSANIEKTIPQKTNNSGLYRFDLVASLKDNPESFWKFIYDKYNSCFILFECKNYKEKITQSQIYTTERYLYNNALRNVAIILTRRGIDENGIKACQDALKEDGKLILVLNDEDIINCIKAYNDRIKDPTCMSPSDLLLKKAKDFLLNLDK